MNNYDKRKIVSYLMYLGANNLYGWEMSQKFPVNGFKWVKNLSQFRESFIKNYDENSDRGYFLQRDAEYPKNVNCHKDFSFLAERKENRKGKKACLQYKRQRKICCPHKNIKTSTKSLFKTKKSTRSNSV